MADLLQSEADAVLQRALELTGVARVRFLDTACPPDTDLRRLVDRLLASCESDEPLLQPGGGASGPLWDALAREHACPSQLESGDRLGAWQVVRMLGRGGMATVYLCERADGQFEQRVALKVLDATRDFEELAVRFAQERQILATLNHPNIARLIDGGVMPSGRPYVVMEYVDGEPIDAYCDNRRLNVEARVELFERVASAVQYAHGHLIVHRDIKPSNILVDAAGEPKLLDFGIAKLLDPGTAHIAPETRSAFHPMTPEYASPEQVRGEVLTTASDVYQAGYLLYQLLTGCPPYQFDRRNVAEAVHMICHADPVRPSDIFGPGADRNDIAREIAAARTTTPGGLHRRLNGDLDNVLLKALRKEPEQRYASLLHLREDLRRHLEGRPVSARPATLAYRAGKFVQRNRLTVGTAALLVVTVIAGLAATIWQAQVAAREARRATEVRDFLVGLFESVDPDSTRGAQVTAKELLDRGASQLSERLADQPDLRAEMLGVAGRMYGRLGLYQEARPLLEQARAALLGSGSSRSSDIATNAGDLAEVLFGQADYEAAERLAREAVALRRESARGHPDRLASALITLASILGARDRMEEAQPLFDEALRIDRLHNDRAALAAHLSAHGVALRLATRNEEAQRAAEEALQLQRELHGDEHTLVATTLVNLGMVMFEVGDYRRSEELLQAALAMRRKLLGERHPEAALVLNYLGEMWQRAGKLDEAERAHRLALEIRRAALGENHPDVAGSLNNLGVSLYYKSRHAEAAKLFAQVLPIFREAYGPLHQETLTVLNNLGAAQRGAGDYEAAERTLREALALRRQEFGDDHERVAQSLNNLALLLAARKRNEEAEATFGQAIAIWRRTLGNSHPDLADGLNSLGRFFLRNDRPADAELPLKEALAIRMDRLEAVAPQIATSRLFLGESLLRLGRPAEAEPLLTASLPILVQRWGEGDELSQRARRHLSEIRSQRRATQ